MSAKDEEGPNFTMEDVFCLQRLAASFEFRARTTRQLEESQDAQRVAERLNVLAEKIVPHVKG